MGLKENYRKTINGTAAGIAPDIFEAGIPKDEIVLGFYLPRRRQLTDFAVA